MPSPLAAKETRGRGLKGDGTMGLAVKMNLDATLSRAESDATGVV